MATKKANRKREKPPTEMIHFRPGAELGGLIGKFATKLEISRGEVAKRFTALTIRGLDLGFYGYADEFSEYISSTFDEAVGQLHVALVHELGADASVVEATREQKVEIIERWIETYRSVHRIERLAEHQHVEIRIYLTE